MLRPGHTLFTYLHLAPDPELTRGLMRVGRHLRRLRDGEDAEGRLPLLAPMSEIAGKIATQAGAFFLEKPARRPRRPARRRARRAGRERDDHRRRSRRASTPPSIAVGMEADVFVFDSNIDRLRELDIVLRGRASTVYSSTLSIEEMLPRVDLVIGAVLVHGRPRPVRDQPRPAEADAASARCSSTCRSTRAAASRPRAPPRTPTPPTRSTASPTTASPTCPARCRSPRPSR